MAKEYREKVEKELRDICQDVLVSFILVFVYIILFGSNEEDEVSGFFVLSMDGGVILG